METDPQARLQLLKSREIEAEMKEYVVFGGLELSSHEDVVVCPLPDCVSVAAFPFSLCLSSLCSFFSLARQCPSCESLPSCPDRCRS